MLAFILIVDTTIYFIFASFIINSLKERLDNEELESNFEISRIFETDGNVFSGFIFAGENEIAADGQLFDIVKTEYKDGKTFYYCYHDKEEENIQKDFWNRHKSKTNNQRDNSRLRLLSTFIPAGTLINYKNFQDEINIPPLLVVNTEKIYFEIITPPPNAFPCS